MSHKASKTCKSRWVVSWDVTWSCPQPVPGTTKLCSTVPDSEVEQRDWLYRIGCEVKVRFCCLINLLSVNLLVGYEIKVNSDEVIKEYLGGQRVGVVTPSLCTGHKRESLWAAGKRWNPPFTPGISALCLCSLLPTRHRLLGLSQRGSGLV